MRASVFKKLKSPNHQRGCLDSFTGCGIIPLVFFGFTAGCHQEEVAAPVLVRPVLSTIAAPVGAQANGYSGIVEPRYQTNLGFRLLGRIVTRDVNVGESVMVGQRLATLDPVVLEIAVRSAEASLANASAQRINAGSGFDRQKKLLAKDATSKREFDLAKEADEAATSAVAQAQADLDKAKEELSYTELKADIDGVVTGIFAEAGQTVSAGQIVVALANPGLREAVVDIGDDAMGGIEPQSEFRVTLQVSEKIECVGKVREIAPQADAKTRTRRVRIALIEPDEAFRLGSTIKAFPAATTQQNIRLPQTAILDLDGSSFVWVVDPTKHQVNRVPVTILRRSELGAEITSGVAVGDRVVTAGVHSLKDGQSIRSRIGDLQ